MWKSRIVLLAMIGALIGCSRMALAQGEAASGLYAIVSGTYRACCGIAGPTRLSLPNDSQAFVRLTLDPQTHLAMMTFLGKDMRTVFSVMACPPGEPINFSFGYGFVFSNSIIFHVDPGPPPYDEFWSYTVSNSADALRIDGQLGFSSAFCSDVPNRFSHSNVVAVLMPTAAIRVSEVEVCWNAASNRTYQVQYRSALTTNEWFDFGAAQPGNGTTNCINAPVPEGEPQRFYRVLAMP